MSGVVERLIGHSAGKRAVSNHSDGIPRLPFDRLGAGQTGSNGNRSAAVSRYKCVIGAFGRFREPGKAVFLAQGVHFLFPACQNLMRIRLMSYIPYNLILRGVEYLVQRNR